jgi:hypothetical protein
LDDRWLKAAGWKRLDDRWIDCINRWKRSGDRWLESG